MTATPGQCTTCSAPILWTRSSIDPNRWNRPLDMETSVKRFVVINGQTIFTDTYAHHTCDNRRAVEFANQERMQYSDPITLDSEAVLARAETKAKPLSPSEERELFHTIACPVPECGSAHGEQCVDIKHVTRTGGNRNLHPAWPHVARRFAALENMDLMHRSDCSREEYVDMQAREVEQIKGQVLWGQRLRALDEKIAEENAEITAKTRCEKCRASRGVECWNLGSRNRGVKEHTVGPHPERRKAYAARRTV